ncbi:MAG: hypothetical protein RML94_14145 [Bacteroidia bacterium]|nr:hypothetical protein [Bacteroidia bacterium]
MSYTAIRFSSSTDSAVPLPPTGKAFLYYDSNNSVFKAKLHDGTILIFNITAEFVEDTVASILHGASSSTINVNHNDPADQIILEVKASSINSSHVSSITPIKIINNQHNRLQNIITTSGNSPATILTFTPATDGMYTIENIITGLRISGTSGNPGDGCSFKRTLRLRRWGGVLDILHIQSDYTSKDNNGYMVGINVSGSALIIDVQGVSGQNMKWSIDSIINYITV